MMTFRIHGLLLGVTFAAVLMTLPGVATAQATNVFKEVADKKDAVQWRNAPDTAIPPDVCSILQGCSGTMKLVALPPATEGGTKVGRGLFWNLANPKQPMILEHQTYGDVYFFLMSPDGALLKAAYHETAKPSWVPMGISLAQPTFDKDKQAWHAWITKLGSAPAAKSGAEAPKEPAQEPAK
jgi:hypothetical protein